MLAGGLLASGGAAAAGLKGLTVEQAIRRLEAGGTSIVYSTDLVKPGFRVLEEPTDGPPAEVLGQILRPYGLDVATGPAGNLLVVRADAPAAAGPAAEVPVGAGALAEIVVTASRYRLELGPLRDGRAITARDLELVPELADDPVRSVARLPGVARHDFSSKPIIRGGISDETLVRFDGLRLYDPYHLKDFHSLASAIDPNIVEGMTVFTAAFPVVYGDRMSGVMDILPVRPGAEFGGRIAASLFNLSALLGGPLDDGRGDWMAALRRGNLDMVLDAAAPDLGRPEYGDAYARIGYRIGNGLRLSANLLVSDDDLTLFDADQEEQATAEYRDQYYWLNLDTGDDETAGARLQLAQTRLSSERSGSQDLPGVGSGQLEDRREFTIYTLALDGHWSPGRHSRLEAGLEWRNASGRYGYSDQANFALLFLAPGAPHEPARVRAASVRSSGDHFAAYAGWRFDLTDALVSDLGLRWDRETLSPDGSDHLGPRMGLLWRADARTRLRLGWGQFFQAQNVNELEVPDGDTIFRPGQRADHWVLGVEREIASGFDLRFEAYRKEYQRLRPRYENFLNPLVVLPELKPDRVAVAPDAGRADGVEASLHHAAGPLAAWLHYGWGRVQDRIGARYVARSWDQEHSVGGGASYRGVDWDLSLSGTWHSGWPTTPVLLESLAPFPLVGTGARNSRRLGDYLRFDLRIARKFEFDAGHRLNVYLEVNNLTNHRSDCCVEYQLEDEEQMPFLDVATVDSLPLVPSVGFVWTF